MHIGHIVPQVEGGTEDPGNLQALRPSCNLVKGRAPHAGASPYFLPSVAVR